MTARVEFLGLGFDRLTLADTLAWLRTRRAGDPFAYLVTPNVDHMVRLDRLAIAERHAYEEADLCLCDSRILARLAGANGVPLTLVPGSDLTRALFDEVTAAGDIVHFIGGTTDHAERLRALHPGLVVRHHQPPMGLRGDARARARVVEEVASTDARFVLLAVGSPQQELLAHDMKLDGRITGTALCIGASVDFLVGAERRAPRLVQRAHMEWAWRLARNPRRLARRYLVDGPTIFPKVWRWRRTRREV